MERRRPFRLRLLLIATAAILFLAFLTRSFWLPAFGYALMRDDGPAKADIAVVLAGDFYGKRIARAAELVRAGYAPAVLVSGPSGIYGAYECDLAIPFAVRKGFPSEWFIPFRHDARSTREEAALVIAELRRRKAASFLLVTSTYHAARSRRLFNSAIQSAGGGLTVRMVAAPDEYFNPESWWRSRESQKIVFFEWCKTLAGAVGM